MAEEILTEQNNAEQKKEATQTVVDSMYNRLMMRQFAQPIFFPSRSMKVKNKRRAAHMERTKRR